MRLPLDTHAFLWFIGGDERLSLSARALIEDMNNDVYLSVASLWEMAIKISLGRLQLAQPFETFIPQQLSLNRIGLLGITISHTAKVATLPFHHCDPFDRLLVVQAQVEQMPLEAVMRHLMPMASRGCGERQMRWLTARASPAGKPSAARRSLSGACACYTACGWGKLNAPYACPHHAQRAVQDNTPTITALCALLDDNALYLRATRHTRATR